MNDKKYGKTLIEKEFEEKIKSRQIVNEILDFGVSQNQILQVMYLLSLNLENNAHMNRISSIIKEIQNANSSDFTDSGLPEDKLIT